MNLFDGRLRHTASGPTVDVGDGARLAVSSAGAASDMPVVVGVRPEHMEWSAAEAASLSGVARVVEPLGADTLVVFDAAGRELQARLPPRVVRRAGDPVHVSVAPESIHLFDPQSGRRL
jgi:multiple sugar transport system ATP-binding protein